MNIETIQTGKAPAAIGPYVQAKKCGDFIFVSGQLGINPESGALQDGVKEQAKQSLENLKAILVEAGSDFKYVVKTTVFLNDMNDFSAVNEVYKQYFVENLPARSAVQVAKLPLNGLVEIEAIAVSN